MIVGVWFGGLFAARALRRADVDVTLMDRNNYHLFQPLLYQMATGILAEGDIAPPIRDVLRHQGNVTVLLGEVMDVDFGAGPDARQPGSAASSVRQPDHGDGREAVLLRPPRARATRRA